MVCLRMEGGSNFWEFGREGILANPHFVCCFEKLLRNH